MFFRTNRKTNPIIFYKTNCDYSLGSSRSYYLSNGNVLLIGPKDKQANQDDSMHLLLIDPIKGKALAECKYPDLKYSHRFVLSISPTEFILVNDYSNTLILNAHTLEKISEIPREDMRLDCRGGMCLDNQKFITISKCNDKGANNDNKYILLTHDLQQKKYNQKVSLPIIVQDGESICAPLAKLHNKIFACQISGRHYDYKMMLFERTPEAEVEFKQIEMITPEHARDSDYCSKNFVPLPDGRLLTYHSAVYDYFQVWEGTRCVDKWSWWDKDIQCEDGSCKRGFWTSYVYPLPDSEHLLIMSLGYKLFLFNMKTRIMKTVDLGKYEPWHVAVDDSGRVCVHANSNTMTSNKLLVLNLKEILNYRKDVTQCLDQDAHLYKDVNQIVTGYLTESTWKTAPQEDPKSHACCIM